MTDFSVTGIVTIDNTQSLLSINEVKTKAEAAAEKVMTLRRKALSTLSMVNSMISQGYNILKRFVTAAGSVVDPLFDALFSMISSTLSSAFAAGAMLLATLNPVLIGIGVTLLIISTELNIKATMDLIESKQLIQGFMKNMHMNVRRAQVSGGLGATATPVNPFSGGF